MTIEGTNRKGMKTKKILVEAAAKCIARDGIHFTSFQSIAIQSGIAQPLVVYHFKNKENIFVEVWNHIYTEALKQTEQMLDLTTTATEKLLSYMKISINFFSKTSEVTRIYYQLHFLSMFDSSMKQINTQIKRKAVQRIASIILQGQRNNEFNNSVDPNLIAKVVHGGLVGLLLNSVTEFEDYELQVLLLEFQDTIIRSLTVLKFNNE